MRTKSGKKVTSESFEKQHVVERTSAGLRDALFDEWDLLRRGLSTPQKASAIARLAQAAVNSVKIEIEYQKHVATGRKDEDHGTVLKLGANNSEE